MFLTKMYTFDIKGNADAEYCQHGLYDTAELAAEAREAYIASQWSPDTSHVYAVEA
jgi:hypothetical protein